MEDLNALVFEYQRRLDDVCKKSYLSEEMIIQSTAYKTLMAQALQLSNELSEKTNVINSLKEYKSKFVDL